ncbi:pyrroline-5-carboxylate reductase [Virgibacillus byunsanensis]|uniref:Pyrroline-5-carboxylate reductase n=1 Tax=Virgibacillus byunsanensis TaxID=570945 RepID=A0ABW3LNH1_9BACI
MEKISFIGAGSMAEAIISGIVKNGLLTKERIFVTNKNNQERLENLKECYDVQCIHDKQHVIDGAEMIILSMKPYDLEAAINSIKDHVRPHQLVVSVVAGISTDYIVEQIGENIPVVRVMPNTSAAVGQSATAISKGKNATEEQVKQVKALFETIGTTTVVEETDMHTVTGISGSGPAYVYYFVEAMERAAIEAGLDREVAKALITQTIIGAGEMLSNSGESAETLRKNITSPAGTTQAGLETLERFDFQKIVMECVKSARERSKELGESK